MKAGSNLALTRQFSNSNGIGNRVKESELFDEYDLSKLVKWYKGEKALCYFFLLKANTVAFVFILLYFVSIKQNQIIAFNPAKSI